MSEIYVKFFKFMIVHVPISYYEKIYNIFKLDSHIQLLDTFEQYTPGV